MDGPWMERTPMGLTHGDKRRYIATRVTLDGKDAAISGSMMGHASITILPDGPSYQWSWTSVAHVIEHKGGAFKS